MPDKGPLREGFLLAHSSRVMVREEKAWLPGLRQSFSLTHSQEAEMKAGVQLTVLFLVILGLLLSAAQVLAAYTLTLPSIMFSLL